jgi:hypothetical protein
LVVEWDADCNGDGIVDYGQCHDGTLADYNGNNIPDCCERGESCVVGNYPVQWRAEDGGNGHWYEMSPTAAYWGQMRDIAISRGGHLATITSAMENAFVFNSLPAKYSPSAFFIGGSKDSGGTWSWVTGEPWNFTNWGPGEPNGVGAQITWIYGPIGYQPSKWNDHPASDYAFRGVIEYEADCNQDGIVDYGQILQGQLADLNADGVPDICQQPTCVDADLFRNGVINGADLGILLSQWGPAPAGTVSDINRDGQVNGADLGYLLNAWGPCTN